MFAHTLIKAVSIVELLARSIMERFGLSGGGSITAMVLKIYLDIQPDNSPDEPINVAMKANEIMLMKISTVIYHTEKYVSLDLSGSPLISIPEKAFENCTLLAGITIPDSVTSIGHRAFQGCYSLASITIPDSVKSIGDSTFMWYRSSLVHVNFQGTIPSIQRNAFPGDLRDKFYAIDKKNGTLGTYIRALGSETWTRQ
jgi:hypothetical protein